MLPIIECSLRYCAAALAALGLLLAIVATASDGWFVASYERWVDDDDGVAANETWRTNATYIGLFHACINNEGVESRCNSVVVDDGGDAAHRRSGANQVGFPYLCDGHTVAESNAQFRAAQAFSILSVLFGSVCFGWLCAAVLSGGVVKCCGKGRSGHEERDASGKTAETTTAADGGAEDGNDGHSHDTLGTWTRHVVIPFAGAVAAALSALIAYVVFADYYNSWANCGSTLCDRNAFCDAGTLTCSSCGLSYAFAVSVVSSVVFVATAVALVVDARQRSDGRRANTAAHRRRHGKHGAHTRLLAAVGSSGGAEPVET